LDIIMPGKDGLTFLEELRNHPVHRYTPVVVMSSKDYRQDKGIARQLGARYLTKPVASRTIQDLVLQLAGAEWRGAERGA
jgi:CheY-like chemotaxis protein